MKQLSHATVKEGLHNMSSIWLAFGFLDRIFEPGYHKTSDHKISDNSFSFNHSHIYTR